MAELRATLEVDDDFRAPELGNRAFSSESLDEFYRHDARNEEWLELSAIPVNCDLQKSITCAHVCRITGQVQ